MNPFYRFRKTPRPWTRNDHKWPTPESDRLDEVLNEFNERQIILSPEEIVLCEKWGTEEREESIRKKLKNRKVSEKINDLEIQIMGYYGQCAVSKYLDVPFVRTTGSFKKPDLPYNIEVKTRSKVDFDLQVDCSMKDNTRKMVLVRFWGTQFALEVVGWIYSGDGKAFAAIDPHNAGKPFHAVPGDSLRPMRELKELIKRQPVTR